MLGKNRLKKVRKKRFLYSHEYRDQKMGVGGGIHAKKFFQKHTNSANKKFWEKNRLIKVRKNVFNIHTKIVTKKWGGTNARNNFSRSIRIMRGKCWEKNCRKKVREMFFYIHTNIATKKWGEKTLETIFPETNK